MVLEHFTVEFLLVFELVFGTDNRFLKNRRTSAISYCLLDGSMTVTDTNNRVSTTSESQL
jgi:hypothetical protein